MMTKWSISAVPWMESRVGDGGLHKIYENLNKLSV